MGLFVVMGPGPIFGEKEKGPAMCESSSSQSKQILYF